MYCYLEIDFNGLMGHDRVPTLEGEENFAQATPHVASIRN